MAIVRTFDGLRSTQRSNYPSVSSGSNYSSSAGYLNHAYAMIYATQPNVRKCVDFLARNFAQVGYHIFRRVSDTDRVRLDDHPVARWLDKPNPATTRYRLFESYMGDLALYFNAYWLKVRLDDGLGLVRVPPSQMRVEGGLLPSAFVWTVDGIERYFPPSEFVYANGYNPLCAVDGLSPIETLRRLLTEEAAAGEHRERYWRNAGRMEGVIERPRDAPKWQPPQKDEFRRQWQDRFTGPASVGQVPVLEDGMTWKQISWSMKDSDYVNARKLTGEECAALWHIPLPMVGYLEHATFSNIKEQHKQLLSDTLGPWFENVDEVIEMQLLPEAADIDGIYGEFNIADKLKGSFEEQTNGLRVAVGRPFMTANEARARLNLPAITNDPSADRLAAQQGAAAGPGVPRDTSEDVTAVVTSHWRRQAARLGKLPVDARAEALDVDRCARELAADLTPIIGRPEALTLAARITDDTYTLLCEGRPAFAMDRPLSIWEDRCAA